MDGPCGCRARGVQDMLDCIRGGSQLSDDFRGRPILYLETRKKNFLKIVKAPEYSLLGGGILTNVFLFFLIKRKESPAQRARANRFFSVF